VENGTHAGGKRDLVVISLLRLDLQRLIVPGQVHLSILSDRGSIGGEEGIKVTEESVHGSGLGRGDGEGRSEVEGFDGCRRDEDVLREYIERVDARQSEFPNA